MDITTLTPKALRRAADLKERIDVLWAVAQRGSGLKALALGHERCTSPDAPRGHGRRSQKTPGFGHVPTDLFGEEV